MDYIYKKWYQDNNQKTTEVLYEQRFHSETTVRTGLMIRPMKQSRVFELYYVPTNDMMLRIERIRENDWQLRLLSKQLPGVAKEQFLQQMIIEELQSSNIVEGVKSTKREIAESTRRIISGKFSTKDRLHSMIQSYLKLQEQDLKLPENPKDVRKIYDFITQGEIDETDLPDGDIFIKDGAEVDGGSGVIHQGVYGEAPITEHIEQWLDFLMREDIPYLIKLAIGHYYFGYIHPFYDGNGRTSRFITSLYLSKRFSIYTAYSLANGCQIDQKEYLELFNRTNKFNSYGEMNMAINTFLDILIAGQTMILDSLRERRALLDMATACIDKDVWLRNDKLAWNVLFIFCQGYLFADNGFERNELEKIIKEHYSSATRSAMYAVLDSLEEKGYILKIKKKPVTYLLNQSFLEQ